MPSPTSSSLGHRASDNHGAAEVIIDCQIDTLYYGQFLAVRDGRLPIERDKITAFIDPSGCGKSTALRCLNRMNGLVRGFRFAGQVRFRGQDIYHPGVDPVKAIFEAPKRRVYETVYSWGVQLR
jgi:phosphate transport system ATP-binding protein